MHAPCTYTHNNQYSYSAYVAHSASHRFSCCRKDITRPQLKSKNRLSQGFNYANYERPYRVSLNRCRYVYKATHSPYLQWDGPNKQVAACLSLGMPLRERREVEKRVCFFLLLDEVRFGWLSLSKAYSKWSQVRYIHTHINKQKLCNSLRSWTCPTRKPIIVLGADQLKRSYKHWQSGAKKTSGFSFWL